MINPETTSPTLTFTRERDATLVGHLGGPWHLQRDMPSAAGVEREIAAARPRRLAFETAALTGWDSSVLAFVLDVTELCGRLDVVVEREGLPAAAHALDHGQGFAARSKGAHGERLDRRAGDESVRGLP